MLCVCVSVCYRSSSYYTSLVSACKQWHLQHSFRNFLDLCSWIIEKSKVMAKAKLNRELFQRTFWGNEIQELLKAKPVRRLLLLSHVNPSFNFSHCNVVSCQHAVNFCLGLGQIRMALSISSCLHRVCVVYIQHSQSCSTISLQQKHNGCNAVHLMTKYPTTIHWSLELYCQNQFILTCLQALQFCQCKATINSQKERHVTPMDHGVYLYTSK